MRWLTATCGSPRMAGRLATLLGKGVPWPYANPRKGRQLLVGRVRDP